MASSQATDKLNIEKMAAFGKRKGFIFASSEIYGGFAAIYDYGHYGALLKDNIAQTWWKDMLKRDDILGLDSAIFMHPKTWEASGHVESFDDPQIDCRNCKHRMRADHYLEKFGLDVDRWPIEQVNAEMDKLREQNKLKCEKCGSTDLTEARSFNLLVKSNLGSPTDKMTDENTVYLRGETCQGIYLNYKNYVQNLRAQLPFGIAQIGKAFRNEIVARQYTFRTREFTQMEMQYFLHPSMMEEKYEYWKAERMKWAVEKLGLPSDKLRFKKHEKLAHYASAAFDIEYDFETLGGFKEVEGIHSRGDWDLTRHQQFSGEDLTYFDQERKEKFTPHIMETSCGLDRYTLAVLDNAYTEEQLDNGETRIVLKLKPSLAPIKAAIMPLTKDEKLVGIAQQLRNSLGDHFMVEYDQSGSIGKRYRRQDEIGTPFCITVDFDTLEDDMVTIRDRDTLAQERVKIAELDSVIFNKLKS